jgi:3-methyladenine DNA glycosylase AlkD
VDSRAIVRRFRAVPANASSLRSERKTASNVLRTADRAEVLAVAYDLIHAGIARFVAYEIVLNHKATMDGLTDFEVMKLGQGICTWGDVDSFACIVAGPAWRIGRIHDDLVRSWAHSSDWFWRRAALVSTVPLNSRARGGEGDARRTIEFCQMLAGDPHDMVQKALSWALRELAKRDSASVRSFLSGQESKLGARVRREVNNKLKTGLKNPRRHA